MYTVSQKVPTCKLSVILSNLNRFSKFLHCWKAYESNMPKLRRVILYGFCSKFHTLSNSANILKIG